MATLPFKQQVLQAREDALIESVNKLLAEKGFDLMTVDEVAANIGIAKASLYKHFPSKEALATAAMNRLLQRALEQIDTITTLETGQALDKIKALTRWAISLQLAGQMPALPAQNSTLRNALVADPVYMKQLMMLSHQLSQWITQAQQEGKLTTQLPVEAILFTLFARACDPVLGALKMAGHAPSQITDWVMLTCFEGLCIRP